MPAFIGLTGGIAAGKSEALRVLAELGAETLSTDAVVHEPGDGGEHIVSEVLRAGYSWQGRVLRPAMVKVTD